MPQSGFWNILFLLLSFLVSAESSCHEGVILANERDVFRETRLSRPDKSECSLSIEYVVDVDTCVFSRLKGVADVDNTNCDKSGCRSETGATTKRIICCCPDDGCNGQKKLIQRDLIFFKKSLEDKPKTNALLLHELNCLMEYFKAEEPARSAIRDFFSDPLHLSLFIFGCLIAAVAIIAIWWLCFKTKKDRQKSEVEETKNLESEKGTTTSAE